jgi:hypothetical protein
MRVLYFQPRILNCFAHFLFIFLKVFNETASKLSTCLSWADLSAHALRRFSPHPLLKNTNFFDGWMKKEKAEA